MYGRWALPATTPRHSRFIAADRTDHRATSTGTHTLILHWNGTKWPRPASPNPGTGNELFGVGATSPASAGQLAFLRAQPEARLLSCTGTAASGRGWPGPLPVAPATNCGLWPPPPPATHGWSAASATIRRRSPSTAADRACDLRRRSGRAGWSARGRRHGPRRPPLKPKSQDPVRTARRLWALVRSRSWPL